MQTLCVVGTEAREVASEIVAALADREQRVASIDCSEECGDRHHLSDAESAASSVDTQITLGADGQWVGSGTDRSLLDVLDSLAPDYEYAVVSGKSHHRLPTVVVGDIEHEPRNVVASESSAASVDVAAIVEQFDEFEPHITLQILIDRAKASPLAERAGAIATFTGQVRIKDSPEDSPTEQLAFEKYEGVAAERMEAISTELTEREGVFEVLMHHRVGVMTGGEDIVFVVVLAGHREEAFETVEDGINRLKDEVPIFKKETTADEEFWLHEREP